MKKSDTKSNYWRVFALCFLTAVLLFLPHCIIDAAAGGGSFYKLENGKRMYFDLASKSYQPVPVNPRELVLVNVKTDSARVVQKFDDASLVDLGDGILCAEFHCKMNAIGPDIIASLKAGVDLLEADKFEGMILANQGPHFSAGANLMLVLGAAMQAQWDFIENMVHELQGVGMRMKYCPKPVVGAPHHYTFGGGVELNMHCAKVVLAGETYAGLVEVGVGVPQTGDEEAAFRLEHLVTLAGQARPDLDDDAVAQAHVDRFQARR